MEKDPSKVQITTSVDEALYMQYKILSVQRRMTLKDMVNEALKAYISKQNADIGIVEPKKAPTAEID